MMLRRSQINTSERCMKSPHRQPLLTRVGDTSSVRPSLPAYQSTPITGDELSPSFATNGILDKRIPASVINVAFPLNCTKEYESSVGRPFHQCELQWDLFTQQPFSIH